MTQQKDGIPLGVISDPAMFIEGASLRDRCFSLLHNVFGMDQMVIENLAFNDNGAIFCSEFGEIVGHYTLVDDALPVIGFTHKNFQTYQRQRKSGVYPCFVPRLSGYDQRVGIMVDGPEMAPPEFHDWLVSNLFTNWMDRPGYKITRVSSPFFQGGYDNRDGKWFYIEFMSRREIYKTVKWINENFRYPE